MQLFFRSIGSQETVKIGAPNPCNFRQIKQILAQALFNSPLSAAAIRLSLNGEDEDFLQSFGITDGDIIYYAVESTSLPDIQIAQQIPPPPPPESETLEIAETVNCSEVDNVNVIDSSVSRILRKQFSESLGHDGGGNYKLVVMAIDSIFYEMGFIGFYQNSIGIQFRKNWRSSLLRLSLCYTLPEIVSQSNKKFEYVVLKLQNFGKVINVDGSLANGSGSSAWFQFHEYLLRFSLNIMGVNCSSIESMIQKEDVFSRRFARKQVIEFRENVKDKLALPLLYELCEKAGVGLPSRFMQLPSDLKLKIFESLPGVDVARLSCVCLELKDLGSSEDLWKLKFTEESGDRLSPNWSWRRTFALFWQDQKKKRATQNRIQPPWHWVPADLLLN